MLTAPALLVLGCIPLNASLDEISNLRSCVCRAGDVDGDGVPDLMVASRDGVEPACVWVLSGKDGRILQVLRSDCPGDGFGCSLANVGDLDGDGVDDEVVGAYGNYHLRPSPSASSTMRNCDPCSRVFSGRSGRLLFLLPADWNASAVGDLDCDGTPDLALNEPWDFPELRRCASVHSGRNGALRFCFDPPKHSEDACGHSCTFATVGDIDGDGYLDFAAASWSFSGSAGRYCGLVELRSGFDGHRIVGLEGERDDACLGWSLVPIGDLDGDGKPDLLAGASNRYVDVLSGLDLHRIHHIASMGGYSICDSFASSLDVIGDVDSDGVPDWVVGANEAWESMFDQGYAWVVSGRTGGVLRQVFFSEDAGVDVCGIGDVDLDGVPDVVLATETKFERLSPFDTGGKPDRTHQLRRVQVISGRTWEVLWQIDPSTFRLQSSAGSARK